MFKVILILLMPLCLHAANLYVSTSGNDAADGSLATPWRTIQHAATNASAGDVITIEAGEYNEFVTPKSGSAGNPITFQGVRGGDGSWQTIIDPSTPITNGWVVSELGTNVYKYTNLTFVAQQMTINHKDVAFVCALDSSFSSALNEAYSGVSAGATLMTASSTQQYVNPQSSFSFPYWDGLEALFCCTNQSAVYLRLRDGSNPNGLNIRVSPNWDYAHVSLGVIVKPAFNINSVSYLVLSNLLVRGAYGAVLLNTSSHDIIISSNYLANGQTTVMVEAGSYNNTICNNQITQDYYGCATPGPWDAAISSNMTAGTNANLYVIGKFVMGADNSAYGSGVALSESGNSNLVYGNHIYSGTANGVNLVATSPMTNCYVFANRIENYPSAGLITQYGEVGTRVYSNYFGNANANIRFNDMDRTTEYTNRLVYIYRNELWLPQGVGEHIYVHWYGLAPVTYPAYWVYQNSFSGGHDGANITPSITADDVRNCRFINNVFNTPYYIYSNLGFWTNASKIGLFDYNEIVPPVPTYPSASNPAWFGVNNKTNSTTEWNYATIPNFQLNPWSVGIDSGADIPSVYPSLPQGGDTKVGSAWDMGVFEYSSNTNKIATATSLHVQNLYTQ